MRSLLPIWRLCPCIGMAILFELVIYLLRTFYCTHNEFAWKYGEIDWSLSKLCSLILIAISPCFTLQNDFCVIYLWLNIFIFMKNLLDYFPYQYMGNVFRIFCCSICEIITTKHAHNVGIWTTFFHLILWRNEMSKLWLHSFLCSYYNIIAHTARKWNRS